MQLIWLRNDLRMHDNTALAAASERGPCLALWLVSPAQWQAHDDAACKVDFWLRNLQQLQQALARLNIPLLVRKAEHWADAPQAVLDVCREHGVQTVHVNEEYGIHEQQRDDAVATRLVEHGISLHAWLDQVLFKPGTVLTRSGGYFKVFTQFRKVCYQRLHHGLQRQVLVGKILKAGFAHALHQGCKAGVCAQVGAQLEAAGDEVVRVDLLIPELQNRGMFKTRYAEGSLREKLFPAGGQLLPASHPGAAYRR